MDKIKNKVLINKAKPLVIKIGSAVLTEASGCLDAKVMRALVRDISALNKKGYRVLIVSSGAIASGMGVLNQVRAPRKLKKKQALAAIGQLELMNIYNRAFAKQGLQIGQILLSHHDLSRRESFLNTRETLNQLFDLGVVPIVNENDTVATEEIEFGDNDQLAVLLANVIEAETVVFLSTVDGLLEHPSQAVLNMVEKIDGRIFSMARGGNNMGRGGMGSKLIAIDRLSRAGKSAFLANGKTTNILQKVLAGKANCTFFAPRLKKMSSKKQWMSHHLKPHGRIFLDKGAFLAVTQKKASLLLAGVSRYEGQWKVGDLISLCYEGKEFARGMSRYSDQQLSKTLGMKMKDIEAVLEEDSPRFIIHKNDIALLDLPKEI